MKGDSVSDLRRTSLAACVLIVLLRLSIGWQFVYEGLWKLSTATGPNPWSAAGYLNNAHGPMRDYFRGMTGDPDELRWLDFDTVSAEWDRWSASFSTHYGLDETQQKELTLLLDGVKRHSVNVKEIPAEVKLDKPFTVNEARTSISIDAQVPPEPGDFAKVREQLPAKIEDQTDAQKAFLAQWERLQTLAGRLSFRQKLRGALLGNPNLTGVVFAEKREAGTAPLQMRPPAGEQEDAIVKLGEKQLYLEMLADYEKQLKAAKQTYNHDHLQYLWSKIQAKKNELVGPVKSLDRELKDAANKLLSYEQIARGPLAPEPTPIHQVNQLTIWALLILGGLLLAGLATRLAAIAGAGMLLSFYMVWPPWPGIPEAPGTEHALYINKNSIEAAALLAIAALPTGSWFGIDAIISKWSRRRKTKKQA